MNSYKFSMDADNDAEGETSQIIILQEQYSIFLLKLKCVSLIKFVVE